MRHPAWIGLVMAGSAFTVAFSSSAVTVALPTIGLDLHLHALRIGWVATSFLLACAASLVPLGRLADIHGRALVFHLGIAAYSAASLLCALATSFWPLMTGRVLQGAAAAMQFATAAALLVAATPPGRRGHVIGINVAAVYLGLAAGPCLGGWLTHQFGWRSLFWVNVGMGLVLQPLAAAALGRERPVAAGERFDGRGALLYVAALVALLLGFSEMPARAGIGLTIGGLAGLVCFVVYAARVPHPVMDVGLFLHNRAFAFSNLAAMINYSATFAVAFFLSLYLQYVKGLSARDAGFVLLCQPLVQTLVSPLSGWLSDRVEPRKPVTAGMLITAVGLVLLAGCDARTGLGYVMACLGLLGAGFGLFASPNTNAIMSAVEPRQYGLATVALGTMRLVGQTLSMGIAMLLFGLFLGRTHIAPGCAAGFPQAMRMGFWIFAALCLIGVPFSMARGNVRAGGGRRGKME